MKKFFVLPIYYFPGDFSKYLKPDIPDNFMKMSKLPAHLFV